MLDPIDRREEALVCTTCIQKDSLADSFDGACSETKESSVPGISLIQNEGKCEDNGEIIWSYIH